MPLFVRFLRIDSGCMYRRDVKSKTTFLLLLLHHSQQSPIETTFINYITTTH
jgi:hypothetical protein